MVADAKRQSDGRFGAGNNANPAGRPKKKTYATLVKECEEKYGKFQHPDYPDADTDELAFQMLQEAIAEGDLAAIKDHLDRKGYRPKDVVEGDNIYSIIFRGMDNSEDE